MVENNKDNEPDKNAEPAAAAPREPFELTILPLQNTTLFPQTVVPLAVGRARSVRAVEFALSTEEKLIGCITVKTSDVEGSDAKPEDLYLVGTMVSIKRMMRAEDVMQLVVQGVDRFRVVEFIQSEPFLKAKVEVLPELTVENQDEVEALKRNVKGLIQEALAMLPQVPAEIRMSVMSQEDPVQLSYFLGSVLELGEENEQAMLEASTVDELLTLAHASLAREVEIMEIRTKIASEAQSEMDKAQRDYVLRQQMKAIQKELGEDDTGLIRRTFRTVSERRRKGNCAVWNSCRSRLPTFMSYGPISNTCSNSPGRNPVRKNLILKKRAASWTRTITALRT
jgi:ATP-dependent Lon protease